MQLLSIIGLLSSFSLAELLTATSAAPDSIVTKAPDIPIELLRKQNNDRYMGWVQISGTWLSRSCDLGGTYFESGDYWRCCATTNDGCNAPIGCITGSLIYSVRNSGTISYITEAWYERIRRSKKDILTTNVVPHSTQIRKLRYGPCAIQH